MNTSCDFLAVGVCYVGGGRVGTISQRHLHLYEEKERQNVNVAVMYYIRYHRLIIDFSSTSVLVSGFHELLNWGGVIYRRELNGRRLNPPICIVKSYLKTAHQLVGFQSILTCILTFQDMGLSHPILFA